MNPTYNMGDDTEMLCKDYFPVITSIKHVPRKGPQIHAPNDILEVRRAIIYKRFQNVLPYPEEVIRIDRSKLKQGEDEAILESYTDYGFKHEMTRLYNMGFYLKRQKLMDEYHKTFSHEKEFLANIYKYKCLKECQFMTRILNDGNLDFKRFTKEQVSELKLSELTDLI